MSTESNKRNANKKPFESLYLNFKHFKIYIQCPNCGNILKISLARKYYCRYCDNTYTENKIREKCGL
ncbi:MAG: hypothetical protein ACFFD7_02800 [Candidatus Thorarchaeota archaeon]